MADVQNNGFENKKIRLSINPVNDKLDKPV
jgi:hypothetical protein